MIWNWLLCSILIILSVFAVSGEFDTKEVEAFCKDKCGKGVDCEKTFKNKSCICKPGYKNRNDGKCEPDGGSKEEEFKPCSVQNDCENTEICWGKLCLRKCSFLHCGNSQCIINETSHVATCNCSEEYKYNEDKKKCEHLCEGISCVGNTDVCYYGSCIDVCGGGKCGPKTCVPDMKKIPRHKCIDGSTTTTKKTDPTTTKSHPTTTKPPPTTGTNKAPGTPTVTSKETKIETNGTGGVSATTTIKTMTTKNSTGPTTASDAMNTTLRYVNTTSKGTTTAGLPTNSQIRKLTQRQMLDLNSTVSTITEEVGPSNDDKQNDLGTGSNNAEPKLPSESSFNFPIMFMAGIVLVVAGYFLYHNRTKLIALVIEGRSGGGEGRYSKLKNVEDAMPRLRNAKASV